MKKILSILITLSIIMAMSVTVFADTDSKGDESFPRVTDRADVLTESEQLSLEKTLSGLSDYHGVDICIRTVNSTGDKSDRSYADDFYDRHYDADGVLLLLNMDKRTMYIATAGNGIKAVTDYGREEVFDLIQPYFSERAYYEGFNEFATQIDRLYVLYEQGTPVDVPENPPVEKRFNYMQALVIALLLGFVFAFLIVNAQKSTLKSVQRKYTAAEYRKEGTFNLTDTRDIYLYHTVNRIPKPRFEDTNHGGPGNMMGGSMTHMSSGGMMHGGGGRSF